MKPVRFDYRRPADVASAIALARHDDLTVKFIAGGQSLGPMLNLRLVQPDLLIDLTGVAELKQVVERVIGENPRAVADFRSGKQQAIGALLAGVILVVGLVWMLAGCVAWIRVGLLEARAAAAHAGEVGD